MIIQLSKSTRALTYNSCVKSKFPLVFHKLYDEIIGKQDDQTIPSTACALSPIVTIRPLIPVSPLTPSAPLPSPFTPPLRPLDPLTLPAPLHSPVTQVPSYPLTPSAPSLLSTLIQVESNKPVQTSTSSKPSTSRNMLLARTHENITNKPPC